MSRDASHPSGPGSRSGGAATKTGGATAQSDRPKSAASREDRCLDYLICRECSTPCYIFEMQEDRVTEALCTVCGNEDTANFTEGDLEVES